MPSPSLLRFEPLPALPVLSTRSTTEHHVSYWKAFERIRGRWRRRAIQIIARRFEIEREVVVGAVRRGTHAGDAMVLAEMAIAAGAKGWRETLDTLYREVGGDFATRIFDRLMDDEDDGEIETLGMAVRERKDARPQITDRWWLTVRSWLDQEAGKRITGITETTRRQVMAQLREGVGAGESIPQLARRVNRLYEDQFTMQRSVLIARTEVIAASNLGSRAGALSTGLELEKVWIATFDDRTREAHMAANGQTVPMDEPYEVGGQRLMFPGDTSLGASGHNVIACRCSEGYRKVTQRREVVYGYAPTPDPEYVERVERNLKDGVQKRAAANGMDSERYLKATEERLAELLSKAGAYIRVSPSTLQRVLKDGRFKTQFEVGRSGGKYAPTWRARVEKEFFGIERTADPATRPIYGYLSENKTGRLLEGERTLDQYGSVAVRLKDDVLSRTTFNVSDSLTHENAIVPSPVYRPSWRSVNHLSDDAMRLRTVDAVDYGFPGNYFEAQFHGGVRTEDIAEVIFKRTPPKDVRDALETAGIKWSVVK